MSATDIIAWFEEAMKVLASGIAGDPPRTVFRCKVCAALVEGSHRGAHRVWHLDRNEELR